MKRITLFFSLCLLCTILGAQTPKGVKIKYTDATQLTLFGQLFPDNPNPYWRVDPSRFPGLDKTEQGQVRCTPGKAVLFKTNSTIITVLPEYGLKSYGTGATGISLRGFDLYIKKGGKWLFAEAGVGKPNKEDGNEYVIIKNMDDSMKECMLYLPMGSELKKLEIGVQEGARIEAIQNPFRHRICIFGSSFTHGASTSRSGMIYSNQLSRMTGLQFINLGCSGHSKLQSYFADILAAADVDALVFDAFSNPNRKQIETRLFPFIETIQKAHPDIPLIFQRTIYRESRNFTKSVDKWELEKDDLVDRLMDEACKKYKNVYYITCTNATDKNHETSVDATHPGDYGYTLWAQSVAKPITKILKKYGIK